MAKRKSASTAKKSPVKKKPAKKSATKKRAAKKGKVKLRSTDIKLRPAQKKRVLKKLRSMANKPSHPSEATGPALELDYITPVEELKDKPKRKRSAPKKKR